MRRLFQMSMILWLGLSGCHTQENVGNPRVLSARNRVAFIEERTRQQGVFAPDYGEVFVMDLDTKETFRITNDGFPDMEPRLSGATEDVAFISTRESSAHTPYNRGLGAPRSLFVYQAQDQRLTTIPGTTDKAAVFDWHPSGRSIIYGGWDDTLWEADVRSNSTKMFLVLPGAGLVKSLSFSPTGEYLAVVFEGKDERSSVAVISMKDLTLTTVQEGISNGYGTEVVSWSPDGSHVLYNLGVKIQQYDVHEHQRSAFTVIGGGDPPSNVFQLLPGGDMLMLWSEENVHIPGLYYYDHRDGKITAIRTGKAIQYLTYRPFSGKREEKGS